MHKSLSVKELCIAAIFTAITAVLAQIAIPLPFTPIPVSFGMIAVYLAGMYLTPRGAAFSQIVYLLLGAVGAPVFAGFQGGLGHIIGPTGGCLFAYPIMAVVISLTLNKPGKLWAVNGRKRIIPYIKASVVLFAALSIEYLFGSLWLSITAKTPFLSSLSVMIATFLLLDIIKIIATVFVFLPVRERFIKAHILSLPEGGKA